MDGPKTTAAVLARWRWPDAGFGVAVVGHDDDGLRRALVALESGLDLVPETVIRIKGSRIGLETLVEDFGKGLSPERIVHRYHPELTLTQVDAAIADDLQNRKRVCHPRGRRLHNAGMGVTDCSV